MRLHPRIAILALCSLAVAQTDPRAAVVKKKAAEVGAATVAGNYGAVLDMTYPPVLEMMGGRAKALSSINTQLKAMKELGVSVTGFKVGELSDFQTGGADLYVIVPTTVEMTAPKSKLTIPSFLVGISSDQGKSWYFADGSRLTPDNVKSMFPNFPSTLKVPEKKPPVEEKIP